MKNNGSGIPFLTSLSSFYKKTNGLRKGPVNKRVLYLSLQAIINALFIGVAAKCLVYLIALITNLSFYGKFSFGSASPAGNQLGLLVIFVPIGGAILVGLM